MSIITTIQDSDLISSSNEVINDNFTNLNTDKIETSTLDTDTTLAANSDSKIATQKAVKAYVDSGGNPNASETQAGIVQEATDAQVTAGTATGSTGAKLFVTPAKLATRTAAVMGTLSTDLKTATVSISSAQILAIHTTPVELIATPGAGKVIVINDVLWSFTAGTQYANGQDLAVRYSEDTVLLVNVLDKAYIVSATNTLVSTTALKSGVGVEQNLLAGIDTAVTLSQPTPTAFITGTGTLKMFIKYRIVTL